jgi:hypothetical protein
LTGAPEALLSRGLLIDIVGMEGMRGRRQGCRTLAQVSVVTALVGRSVCLVLWGEMVGLVKTVDGSFAVEAGGDGFTGIEHESLILAQNERWRHA